jgi:hypothetical protein
MMAHIRALLKRWGCGAAILSPRDLEVEQTLNLSRDVVKMGCEALIDPQCFVRDADRERLFTYPFWATLRAGNSTANLLAGPSLRNSLVLLRDFSREAGVERYILPGFLAESVNEFWIASLERTIEIASDVFGDPARLIPTIALGTDTVLDEEAIETVIETASKWEVPHLYVVAETPTAYLVDDPSWLGDLATLVAGLELAGKSVTVGYCSHQMLLLIAANAHSIASGNWLNVRAFPPEKFYQPAEKEHKQNATWYYCPQALSEYKLTFLTRAKRAGVLPQMEPPKPLRSEYSDAFFSATDPASIKGGQQSSFRHYLNALHEQAAMLTSNATSFDAAVKGHEALLDNAAKTLKQLREKGVYGQDREFTEYLDVNRSALAALKQSRGALLRRRWRAPVGAFKLIA